MVSNILHSLRPYVNSLHCRYRLPWFHDGTPAFQRFRRRFTYNVPAPPLYLRPLIACSWMLRAISSTFKMLCRHGSVIRKREGIPLSVQCSRLLVRAWFRNHSPYYSTDAKMYRRALNDTSAEYLHSYEMQFYYNAVVRGHIDIAPIASKLYFPRFCNQHSIPTIPLLYIATGQESREPTISLPRQDLFSKPVNSWGGKGVACWKYDACTDKWSCGGEWFDEAGVLRHLEAIASVPFDPVVRKQPHILQPRIRNHPLVAKLSLEALNTARVMTLCTKGSEPRVLVAALRMSAEDSIYDSCYETRLAAPIDLETGRLGTAIRLNTKFPDCDIHPATGQQINGLQLPNWDEVKQLVVRAHTLAPPLATIGWDIAFTPEGPLIVEANTTPQVEIVQMAHGRSIMTDEFVDALLSWQTK